MRTPRWALVALLAIGCHAQPLDVVPELDLARFAGSWYEIAKLPRPTQASCVGTTASYELQSESELTVVHTCRLGSRTGQSRTLRARAKVPDRSVPAKLSVDFGGFYGDYWVIDVGRHYEYAVIGHPTRQYLWILSRTATLDPDALQGVLGRASEKGFDVSRLEFTEQVLP
jgi:apolipoprotein D and lipocalin family protein